MTLSRRSSKTWRSRLPMLAGSATGLVALVCVGAGLAFLHVPRWYRPPWVPESEYQSVRDSLVRIVSDFSDRLVVGKPFDLTLDDHTLSCWLAIRSSVWPDAGAWVPPYLRDPVVVFRPGSIVLAARFEKDGWQAILSAHVCVELAGDRVIARLSHGAGGSLPIPVAPIAKRLHAMFSASGLDVDAMPDLMADAVRFFRSAGTIEMLRNGVPAENRFQWENGKRWFRIAGLKIETGRLHLRIEPLAAAPRSRASP